MTPVRGRVYWVDLDGIGRKPFLIVSNNSRNRSLGNFLGVRLTTTLKERRTSVIPLGPADRPLVGRVLCDEITLLYPDELAEDIGALSFATMATVNAGLRAALAL